jgi:hypothetical protein
VKTAVCIHGLARGSASPAQGAYNEKYKTLLSSIKDTDIFIHSWDIDIKEELKTIFNPINSIFESQKSFKDEINFFKKGDIYSTNTSPKQGEIFRTLSFLYSRYESLKLKSLYEKENDFIYDCVLTTRFDVGHVNGGSNKTSYLKFDQSLDMNYLYQAYWNQTNAGASDHWFYSNSENMDIIGNLYNKLFEYLVPDSEYHLQTKNGWPLSNASDEFSNEMFNETPTDNLKKLSTGNIILVNNHCIYKYHLMINNLWKDKSIFLNKNLWNKY